MGIGRWGWVRVVGASVLQKHLSGDLPLPFTTKAGCELRHPFRVSGVRVPRPESSYIPICKMLAMAVYSLHRAPGANHGRKRERMPLLRPLQGTGKVAGCKTVDDSNNEKCFLTPLVYSRYHRNAESIGPAVEIAATLWSLRPFNCASA